MQLNLKNAINLMLIIFGFLLPIQAVFVLVLHFPNFVQMLYPFITIGFVMCCFMPLKRLSASLDKNFIVLFVSLLITMLISVILNYDAVCSLGMTFSYIVSNYSKFWDSPDIRLFNWGILRPFLLYIYILILFVFLNFKNAIKILLKTLIILAIISSLYSIYQIVAGWVGLPYGSLFSGHAGNEIFLFGKLRRPEGLFYEPGPQATFLSPIFCILLFQLFEKNKLNSFFSPKITRWIFSLITFVLIFTFSPIGILTVLLATVMSIIINHKKFHFKMTKTNIVKLITVICIGIVFISLITSFIQKATNKNFTIAKYMLEKILISTTVMDSPIIYTNPDSRSVRTYSGIEIFKDNIIFGCGPGGAISYYFKHIPFTANRKLYDQHAVINTHVKMLCELGILGFICYLAVLIYPLFLYIKNYRNLKSNKLLIDSLVISLGIYITISYQATLQFWMPYFWMIYVPLVVLIRKEKYETK